jgi:uncharacterized protein
MTTELNAVAATYVIKNLQLPARAVQSVLELIYQQNCTVPFIARYRKEATGNLDEVAIRDIQKNYDEFIEIEKRQAFIVDAIKKQEKLTPALEKKILSTFNLSELEDIYAPFKVTKKTKATIAKEYGLEPLANLLLTTQLPLAEIEKQTGDEYIKKSEGKIKNFAEALIAAQDIIIEQFAHHVEAKKKIRDLYWHQGQLVSEVKKDAATIPDYLKFKDFFDFKEPLNSLKEKKSSHRYLAMRRGLTQKVLKVEVACDSEIALNELQKQVVPQLPNLSQKEIIQKSLKKALDIYIHPSLDLEIKMDLKNIADEAAIDVFGVNLKNLLLQPYLGSKAVLGIDPGQRTGCKIVVIDESGKFIGDHVIYPHPPQEMVKESAIIISKIIEQFNIEHIAIGNGTAGLETLHFVQEHIKAVQEGKCHASLINEAGASIYSASDVAREEYPDKDVTVRGAISIAKRFQDPLAELVKIDAKSLGVGQYQHDVNQSKLQKSLDAVVESCVNFVGVDLNTASPQLLSYISGIGPTVAQNIVSFRHKNGHFKSRKQLLDVSRFTDKSYQQSVGFLRIYQGDNPLDATFIHPEQYPILEEWCKEHSIKLQELVHNKEIIHKLSQDQKLKDKIGVHTFDDIVKALKSPRQDPRQEFKNTEFNKAIKKISDLKIGDWYTGVVNNITNFGAFVDLGIKESGLLHISEMSNTFVKNALDHVQVGQEVKVRVIEVDLDRKRVSLSCKTDTKISLPTNNTQSSMGATKSRNSNHPMNQPKFSNNPFASLGGKK